MHKELYFLRSSEQNIVNDMVAIAHPNSTQDLSIYTKHYGLTTKDLGLYILVDNKVAGAIWSREVDGGTPLLSVAILSEFKSKGVGAFMMQQFLQEAAAQYEKIHIDINLKKKSLKFYEKFGFTQTGPDSFLLTKTLEKKAVQRPSDNYDPTYWMD